MGCGRTEEGGWGLRRRSFKGHMSLPLLGGFLRRFRTYPRALYSYDVRFTLHTHSSTHAVWTRANAREVKGGQGKVRPSSHENRPHPRGLAARHTIAQTVGHMAHDGSQASKASRLDRG